MLQAEPRVLLIYTCWISISLHLSRWIPYSYIVLFYEGPKGILLVGPARVSGWERPPGPGYGIDCYN